MILHTTQKIVAADNHRYKVINCGRRWGKTTYAVEEIKAQAVWESSPIAYIATTYQQARDIAWNTLKKEIGTAAKRINESRLEIVTHTRDGGESIIQLKGWENIETLRGQKFKLLVIDEVASMRNFKSMWEEVIRPTLTDYQGKVLFISTPKGFNHFYDLYNKEAESKDYKSFHFTSYDNPHILREELDDARKDVTEDRFYQEYMADFRKTEGLVYKEFERSLHLYNEEDPLFQRAKIIEKIGGLDFGFTNPCAELTILKDSDNHYWVDEEWYVTGRTEDEIAERTATQGYTRLYPDPEAPSSIETLRRHKVNVRDVLKNKDSVKNGINVVRELFKSGRLKINVRCTNLIWELETYSYPEKKDQHNEDENPIKENDHAMDALRYPLFMLEYRPQTKAQQFIPNDIARTGIIGSNMFKTSSQLENEKPRFAKQFIPR